jgi:hypothetical protein
VVDLNRLEQQRLAKLGEGSVEILAEALVPSSMGRLLEGGPRAIHRARRAVAYGEKWEGRSGLPSTLAQPLENVRMLPCLPSPSAVRRWDGAPLDPRAVQGPGGTLGQLPTPTLALLGLWGGLPAGCCLAVDDPRGVVLGAWLELDVDWEGALDLVLGAQRRRLPLDAWRGLTLPELRACEVLLAPPPHLRRSCAPKDLREIRLEASFETLILNLDKTLVHPTVQ